MRLTEDQWSILEPLLPKLEKREDGKGRLRRPDRDVLEGILWVLKTGAGWCKNTHLIKRVTEDSRSGSKRGS